MDDISLHAHLSFLTYFSRDDTDCVEVDGARICSFMVRDRETLVEELIIAFRGTNNVNNLLVNLIPCDADYHDTVVHRGYLNHYKKVRDHVYPRIDEYVNNSKFNIVKTTGHSLGGACASICALDIGLGYPSLSISSTTFGSPPVGNKTFIETFDRHVNKSVRVINEHDPVPLLNVSGKLHVGKPMIMKNPSRSLIKSHDIKHYIRNIDKLRSNVLNRI
jgi:predicted lipase